MVVPESVITIGYRAFYGCISLNSIKIPSSVTNIDNSAFSGCSSLSSIEIPASVTSFGMNAFEGTKWLENKKEENPLVIVNGILIDGTACSGSGRSGKDRR